MVLVLGISLYCKGDFISRQDVNARLTQHFIEEGLCRLLAQVQATTFTARFM
jgi:hypothetical protein